MLELLTPYIIPSYRSSDNIPNGYEYNPYEIHQMYAGNFPSLPEYYGESFQKSVIKYTDISPTSVVVKGDDEIINPEYIKRGEIYDHFLVSFSQHGGDQMPVASSREFDRMAELLSELPIRESLVQYSTADNMIDFLLVLNDGIRLSIGKFTDEDDIEEIVEFSVYNKRELMLSGETSVEQLVKKIRRIHKIQL